MNKGFSKREAKRTIAAVETALKAGHKPPGMHKNNRETGAIAEAAKALGLAQPTVHNRVAANGSCERWHHLKVDWSLYRPSETEQAKRDAAAGLAGFSPVLEGYEIKSTTTQYDAHGDVKSQSVKQGIERGDTFQMPEGHLTKGVSALLDGDGRIIAQWIKTKQGDMTASMIDAIKAVFAEYNGRARLGAAPKHVDDNYLTVYPIADLHVGMYSWAPESGEDYDLKIVEEILMASMRALVMRSPPSETGLILNLGDFFHADSRNNRTEISGHALDVDSRYARVLQIGIRLLIACIELALERHARVIVRSLPGNHDYHSSLALTAALGAFFHDSDRVIVDQSPSKFFFHLFGRVLIAATHGDAAKPDELAGIVAAMQPDMWGRSLFRYGYSGHIHHRSKRVSEMNGMIWETFQTLAAKDFWHASMGFCAGRSMPAITYHKDYGECDRVTVSLPPAVKIIEPAKGHRHV